MDLSKVKETFNKYFGPWDIKLPEPTPDKGNLFQAGWSVSWSILEGKFYLRCGHRMTNERFHIILEDGSFDESEQDYCIREMYPVGTTEAETATNLKDMQDHNAKCYAYYKTIGLE